MKYPIPLSGFTFNATAKTVTFTSPIPASIVNILHVANITRGVIYFQPQAGSAFTGTYAAGVLTLACSTTGHANGDELLIIYEDGIAPATAAKQDTGNGSLASIDGKVATETSLAQLVAKIPASPATDRATAAAPFSVRLSDGSSFLSSLPVTGTFWQATQPISAASLPLPTGAATDRATAAAPFSVRLSDGTSFLSALPVTGTFWQATQPVSAANLPLPTGAATESGNLATILGRLPSGLAVASGRLVVDGSGVTQPISAASLPLPSGAATSANQATTNGSLSSIDGKLPSGLAVASGRLVVDGSGVYQPVTGAQVVVTASFTRPANTTQYAANQAVSSSTTAPTILEFQNAARIAAGGGVIVAARHIKASTTTTNAFFRLWLWRSSVSATNDGAAFALLNANRSVRIGYIDFFSHQGGGTGSDCTESQGTFIGLPFVLPSGTSLFGQLIATAAYIPTSGEQHTFELIIQQL